MMQNNRLPLVLFVLFFGSAVTASQLAQQPDAGGPAGRFAALRRQCLIPEGTARAGMPADRRLAALAEKSPGPEADAAYRQSVRSGDLARPLFRGRQGGYGCLATSSTGRDVPRWPPWYRCSAVRKPAIMIGRSLT